MLPERGLIAISAVDPEAKICRRRAGLSARSMRMVTMATTRRTLIALSLRHTGTDCSRSWAGSSAPLLAPTSGGLIAPIGKHARDQVIVGEIATLRATVATEVDPVRIAHDRYGNGYTPCNDRPNAQSQLLQSQLSLASSHPSRLNPYVSLLASFGGGRTPADQPLGRPEASPWRGVARKWVIRAGAAIKPAFQAPAAVSSYRCRPIPAHQRSCGADRHPMPGRVGSADPPCSARRACGPGLGPVP